MRMLNMALASYLILRACIVQEADPNEEGIVVGFLAPGEYVNNQVIYI